MLSVLEFIRAAGASLPAVNYKTPHWAIWTRNANGVLTDEDEVDQTIITICSTALGTDPLRPEFGCEYLPLLDSALNVSGPLLTSRITKALATWELRIKVLSVVVAGNERGVVEITITWQWAAAKAGAPRLVSFALQ